MLPERARVCGICLTTPARVERSCWPHQMSRSAKAREPRHAHRSTDAPPHCTRAARCEGRPRVAQHCRRILAASEQEDGGSAHPSVAALPPPPAHLGRPGQRRRRGRPGRRWRCGQSAARVAGCRRARGAAGGGASGGGGGGERRRRRTLGRWGRCWRGAARGLRDARTCTPCTGRGIMARCLMPRARPGRREATRTDGAVRQQRACVTTPRRALAHVPGASIASRTHRRSSASAACA